MLIYNTHVQMQPLILFFGNPLLDISVTINDTSILQKYGLNVDDQRETEPEIIEAILKEVSPSLQEFPDLPTGYCVCLINGDRRSLLANIGAASHFSLDFLLSSTKLQSLIDEASIIHVEGFFLSDRFQVCQYLVKNVQMGRGKFLSYNLNAPYVCEQLLDESAYMAENADLVMGNVVEFETLGRLKYGLQTAADTAQKIYDLWRERRNITNGACYKNTCAKRAFAAKDPFRLGKIIAVTQNSKPVLVIWGKDDCYKQFIPIPQIDPKEIVDTTGGGDAFMGGFMYAILSGRNPPTAVHYAASVAAAMIKVVGTDPPDRLAPSLDDFPDVEQEAVTESLPETNGVEKRICNGIRDDRSLDSCLR